MIISPCSRWNLSSKHLYQPDSLIRSTSFFVLLFPFFWFYPMREFFLDRSGRWCVQRAPHLVSFLSHFTPYPFVLHPCPSRTSPYQRPQGFSPLFLSLSRIISWLGVLCPAKSLPVRIVEKWLMLHFSCGALKIQKIRSPPSFWDSRKKNKSQ